MLDTLKLTRSLESRGVARAQAEAIAEGLGEGLKEDLGTRLDGLASKADLGRVEQRLDRLEAEVRALKADVADLKSDMRLLKWGQAALLALIGSAVLKYVFS